MEWLYVSIFNYDGDEERTPIQSEEDSENKNKVSAGESIAIEKE